MQNSGNVGCSIDSKLPKAKPSELETSSELEVFKAWSLGGGIELGMSFEALIARGRCAKASNDPKLSDGRGWRGPCKAGGKAAAEARAVTATPVRCSAWLGVRSDWRQPRRVRAKRRMKTGTALPPEACGGPCGRVGGSETNRGLGAGGKPSGKHACPRTECERRRRADGNESEAQSRTEHVTGGQTGETQRIAARVPAGAKPSKCGLRSAPDTKPFGLLAVLVSELVIADAIRGTVVGERLPTPSSATPGRGRGCEHGGARRRRGLCRASWRAAQPVTEPVGPQPRAVTERESPEFAAAHG